MVSNKSRQHSTCEDRDSMMNRAPEASPVLSAALPRRGLGVAEVRLEHGFWGTLQATNAANTVRHCLEWMERLGWIENFDAVADGLTAGRTRPGWQFADSEIYKLLEALAWESGRSGHSDPELDAIYAALVDRVTAAQDEDGYLNTCFGHEGQPPRYSDMEQGHELYCVGHLLQAAVARLRVSGEDALVVAARKAADHVCDQFGETGNLAICGHPEIEVALAEFARATGEDRYRRQALLFLDRRGHGLLVPPPLLSAAYFQDDVPLRDVGVFRGHAVRALYLGAGTVDIAYDSHDDALMNATLLQWENTVAKRTYITGGMGSRHQDEGFGDDWELPPDRAYCETCAGVASVMLAWRLYLVTGDVKYPDLIERTLYNVIATSPRSDGRAFFYANPLQQREAASAQESDPQTENRRAEGGVRAPWFDVSCCPTNVARTLASLSAYVASTEGETLSLLQYASGRIQATLTSGSSVDLAIETDYPNDGRVRITVLEAPSQIGLRLRVPSWARGTVLMGPDGAVAEAAPGWVDVAGPLKRGDVIVLDLPVEPRFTWPDRRVDAVRGCVAVEQGPQVLCLEDRDLPSGIELEDMIVDSAVTPRRMDGKSYVSLRSRAVSPGSFPYNAEQKEAEHSDEALVPLIPYNTWAERGASSMRVFIPRE